MKYFKTSLILKTISELSCCGGGEIQSETNRKVGNISEKCFEVTKENKSVRKVLNKKGGLSRCLRILFYMNLRKRKIFEYWSLSCKVLVKKRKEYWRYFINVLAVFKAKVGETSS